jgi:hypothetical protein
MLGTTLRRSVLLRALTAALALHAAASAATITVTNTNDTGAGSLRDAINQSNTSTGVLDTIAFDVTGTGCSGSPARCVIAPAFPGLPAITDPVVIDATTQPLYAGSPLIQINWTVQAGGNGLTITGGGSTVKGLSITRFSTAIALGPGGNNTIQGNWLGVDLSGAAAGNGYGVDADGSSNNQIGGTTAAQRNVISANNPGGVHLTNGSSSNVISGNYIGTDPAGTASFGNGGNGGVWAGGASNDNRIGGTAAGSGNVIAGGYAGIWISASGTLVQGNFIGTDKTGMAALGNGGAGGVAFFNSPAGNTIGGSTAAARNVISGNAGPGINAQGGSLTTNVIQGNFIGTDAAGTGDLGNDRDGIFVGYYAGTPSSLKIGGAGAGEGNLIAFNGKAGAGAGVWVYDVAGVEIRGNSIHDNVTQGIDLGNPSRGPTLNDAGDADAGANNLQNFPSITSSSASSVSGTLNSTASTAFTLDFYASPFCSSSGFGEGKTYLGSLTKSTDGTGNLSFTASLTVPAGQVVTATATDPSGNTSEFSQCGSLVPGFLEADRGGAASDGNFVFEPGETADVRSTWKNPTAVPLSGDGTASNFTGPAGPSYAIVDNHAAFPYVGDNSQASCQNDCYSMSVSNPGSRPEARPATHWDATFTETLTTPLVVPKVWKLHLGDSFTDVPRNYLFYAKVETVFHNAITVGCTASTYCPDDLVPRDQMAIFIARSIAKGGANVPASGTWNGKAYNCAAGGVSLFSDVVPASIACKSIHYIAVKNVTSGCSAGIYCPTQSVTRAQMSIFMAKAIVAPAGGAGLPETYGPDPNTGNSYSCNPSSPSLHFIDVTASDSFCKHVHYLWARNVIAGCTYNQYCPTGNVTRGEMAKFLGNAFGLQLYGP